MKRACFVALFGLLGSSLLAGQLPAAKAKVESFVGTWGGYIGNSSTISGSVEVESRYMKVVVTKGPRGDLALKGTVAGMTAMEGNRTVLTATLKVDKATSAYLLSYTAGGSPAVVDLPLTYSEAEGFSGTATFTREGKEYTATATIKDKDGVPEWVLETAQAKDSWSFRFGLRPES